ncbi:MAG: magnesium transporter [Candidatus Peribacteraceae bacterium]|nr:magnesium transporter [Candidatus Peribacteraceae bacterium]
MFRPHPHPAPHSSAHPWRHDSAGSRMTRDVPVATAAQTLAEVAGMLRRTVDAHSTINYIYVLDAQGRLTGILSIRELYRHALTRTAGDICRKTKLVTVHPDTDQERVVYLSLKHNIKAVPVTDDGGVFLGVIPSDVILSILYKEAHEDLLRLAGIHGSHPLFDNVLTLPLWKSFLHRIPWLLLGLLGGLLAARLIGSFEETLERNIVLAAFIPLIVYMSDAVRAQLEAFVIRDAAMERRLPFVRYFLRQSAVLFFIALTISAALALTASFTGVGQAVAVVLALSLFAAVCSSAVTGLLIPHAFAAFRMDPANGSGPVATIIQDLLSIFLYFLTATWLL